MSDNAGNTSPGAGGESANKSRRIRVAGASGKEEDPELLSLFAGFGSVQKIERHSHQDGVLVVAMETVEEANAAVAALNGRELDGSSLSLNNTAGGQRWQPSRRGAAGQSAPAGGQSRDSYPLRLLVHSEHVGTIIGKGGGKIKEITASSGARIDIRRQFMQGPSAGRQIVDCQTVHITGTPEACSRACKDILLVANTEAKAAAAGQEVELSILAESRFCGRIIGKDGKNLKALRDKTKTAIQLSHSPAVTSFELAPGGYSSDRIVTVRGSLSGVCEAEALVSETLRQGHRTEATQRGGPPIGAAYGAGAYGAGAYGAGAYGAGAYGAGAYGAGAYIGGAGCAPGWPYVTFTALDPERKFKKVAINATT